jgi:hypothetical protein
MSRPPLPSNPGSSSQNLNPHAPSTPSGLRVAHTFSVSPEDRRHEHGESSSTECSPRTTAAHGGDDEIEPISTIGGRPAYGAESHKTRANKDPGHEDQSLLGHLKASAEEAVRETTALLGKPVEIITGHIHPGPCNHGTFSPKPCSRTSSVRSSDGNKNGAYSSGSRGIFGSIADGLAGSIGKKMSTTARLAEEHGIDNSKTMYVLLSVTFTSYTFILDVIYLN